MSAKLAPNLRIGGVAWSAQRIPTAVNLGSLDQEPLLFHSSSSSVILTRLSGPRSRPTTSQKITGNAGNRTRVVWIGSQELWPVDHRGGHKVHTCFQQSYHRSILLFGHLYFKGDFFASSVWARGVHFYYVLMHLKKQVNKLRAFLKEITYLQLFTGTRIRTARNRSRVLSPATVISHYSAKYHT
jgi:hypothetical protein